ncbi:MAG TPA: hypothetical protein VIJ51_14765 [Solirubrobacteraceae bacterium]
MILALTFFTAVLAVHIMFVVIAFGVIFAYPLVSLYGRNIDPSGLPWFHRLQGRLGRTLISPGLAVVLIAGIYLASKLHSFSDLYVQWGFAAVIVLGGLSGGYLGPRETKLATLAERDLSGPGGKLGAEYLALSRQVDIVGGVACLIVLVTILLMAAQTS